MLLQDINLHEKRITVSQEGRNFGSARASLLFAFVLKLSTCVTGRIVLHFSK